MAQAHERKQARQPYAWTKDDVNPPPMELVSTPESRGEVSAKKEPTTTKNSPVKKNQTAPAKEEQPSVTKSPLPKKKVKKK